MLSDRQRRVLVNFIQAQLFCLWNGCPGDNPHQVADDIVCYLQKLPKRIRDAFGMLLSWLHIYSLRRTRKAFDQLSPCEVWTLLNQGEFAGTTVNRRRQNLLTFDDNYVEHLAVSTLSLLVRLVSNSRNINRLHIGMVWSPECRDPKNLVHIDAPPFPDLSICYDVCVVGSGAGGSLVAAKAVAAGKRVLIIEVGKWMSPDSLIERHFNEQGKEELLPARSDRVLMHLYKNAGLQIAGGLADSGISKMDIVVPRRREKISAVQSTNVLQAQVVGGGPYVNNAIHLPMRSHVWEKWGWQTPIGVSYEAFKQRTGEVQEALGVNSEIADKCASERSAVFARGCKNMGEEVVPVAVAVRSQCKGCGSDNAMDPFGSHVGGVHPYHPGSANSYLMQALNGQSDHAQSMTPCVPAVIAPEMRAKRFDIGKDQGAHGGHRACRLIVEDRRCQSTDQIGPELSIRAKRFVLSAGPVASTRILQSSYAHAGLRNDALGCGFNGNVGTPVFALFEQPLVTDDYQRPEPGIAQCFLVDEQLDWSCGVPEIKQPGLENWFHYPGTVALALTGWFQEYARVMQCYNRLSIAGMFVPTKVRPENRISPEGKISLALDDAEFELVCRGIERIAKIYLAAAEPGNAVELFLPTKGLLLDHCNRPVRILDQFSLAWAMKQIRCRGPEFINLLSSHPQGGNALGTVVDRQNFQPMDAHGRTVDNLLVADASVFPAGCEINPQLTVKALASIAAERMLAAA